MAEKVTTMVLDVDLTSSKCCKKVKKVLCKFPEIRDQTYDEKANKVKIKVVSGSPEKIRDKLCCKGRGCIMKIEIPPPPIPPTSKPPTPPPTPPPPPPPPKVEVLKFCCYGCYSGRPWGPCWCGYGYSSGCGYYCHIEENQPGCTVM